MPQYSSLLDAAMASTLGPPVLPIPVPTGLEAHWSQYQVRHCLVVPMPGSILVSTYIPVGSTVLVPTIIPVSTHPSPPPSRCGFIPVPPPSFLALFPQLGLTWPGRPWW